MRVFELFHKPWRFKSLNSVFESINVSFYLCFLNDLSNCVALGCSCHFQMQINNWLLSIWN